jgi:hypothetical protein
MSSQLRLVRLINVYSLGKVRVEVMTHFKYAIFTLSKSLLQLRWLNTSEKG